MKKTALLSNKIYVKSFPGATTSCMIHHVKPSLKFDPDLLILHSGSNALRSEKRPSEIADDIVNLAIDMKNEKNDVMVSGIVPRNDNMNIRGQKVNELLKLICARKHLGYIDNSNIIPEKHLNGSGSNLNYRGTIELANNFLDGIKL